MISRAVRGLGDSDVIAASDVELSLDFTRQISDEYRVGSSIHRQMDIHWPGPYSSSSAANLTMLRRGSNKCG